MDNMLGDAHEMKEAARFAEQRERFKRYLEELRGETSDTLFEMRRALLSQDTDIILRMEALDTVLNEQRGGLDLTYINPHTRGAEQEQREFIRNMSRVAHGQAEVQGRVQ